MTGFDSYAHDYDAALNRGLSVSGEGRAFFAEGRIRWLRRCLASLDFRPETVLDYGCGTGMATRFFLDVLGAQRVVGIDVSAESIELARKTHRDLPAEYWLADEYQPNATVDLAFCNGVYHHVAPSDRAQVTGYIARCLRPGGAFALWENNPWNPGTRYVMYKIPFDRDALPMTAGAGRQLMRGAGFEVLQTNYCFIFPRILRIFRVVEPYLTRLPLGAQYQLLGRLIR